MENILEVETEGKTKHEIFLEQWRNIHKDINENWD